MENSQQKETLYYFKGHAGDWQDKAMASSEKKVNIIQQRNGYVIASIKDRSDVKAILDVGCGTGDLVIDLAKQGINASGIDFAQDMIDIALKKVEKEDVEKAHFACCSLFDFDFSDKQFSVISANGFIEYISQDELEKFFNIVYEALPSNGSFIVGSRNRLFNLFSLNAYTEQELNGLDVDALLKESVALASGKKIEDIIEMGVAPLQNDGTKHANTGIDVTTRFQYTPFQLIGILNAIGFEAVDIYPIHIHSVPFVFKTVHPRIHASISNTLQTYAQGSLELVPFSSSFMLHLKKD